jgi:hypothetical protein
MEGNQEGKSEKAFKNFGKKVDNFIDELEEASEKLQKEFQAKFEELKVSAEKFKKEAEDKERWKEVENNLKKAGEELSNAFKSAFSKRPEKP